MIISGQNGKALHIFFLFVHVGASWYFQVLANIFLKTFPFVNTVCLKIGPRFKVLGDSGSEDSCTYFILLALKMERMTRGYMKIWIRNAPQLFGYIKIIVC
ncbi:hypothetical protein CHARACLAT_033579 [Characodon lateralis]|uniref:Uncharacterized protein n=1 Tax=Characodon lateralis TaxID=208331 RepID=A0ABU7D691_9TELE|nr:hypothetical protein [Characodon lateralis]